jgi:hypothetical protein
MGVDPYSADNVTDCPHATVSCDPFVIVSVRCDWLPSWFPGSFPPDPHPPRRKPPIVSTTTHAEPRHFMTVDTLSCHFGERCCVFRSDSAVSTYHRNMRNKMVLQKEKLLSTKKPFLSSRPSGMHILMRLRMDQRLCTREPLTSTTIHEV